MANNTLFSVDYPSVVSKYTKAYDFEIVDLPSIVETMNNLTIAIFALCLVYIVSIFALQSWMKNRPAYDLRKQLVIWNFALAIFSICGTLRQLPEVVGILSDNGIYAFGCSAEHHNYATSYWSLLFTLSKIVELGDTLFIVLRKKKLIFLHWFHHATVLFFGWITFVTNDPAVRRGGIINYSVHSIMYMYFAFRAMDFDFPQWQAKIITCLQILQFTGVAGITAYTLCIRALGTHCARPLSNDFYIVGLAVIYLTLFVKFFMDAYGSKNKLSKKVE